MIKQPMLYKVFLALRTNFFPTYKNEHVTLVYFHEIRWDALLDVAHNLDRQLPATIRFDGFSEWEAESRTFCGALVSCHDTDIFKWVSMPHITLDEQTILEANVFDIPPYEVIDRLYIGKKINGQLIWATIKTNQIGPGNAAANFPNLTGNDKWDKRFYEEPTD
jgi:hypothetical protein